jgi:hypothetical protein
MRTAEVPTILSRCNFQCGDERQFLGYGFGTAAVGTGTFNFRQSAAKRGSSL